MAWEVTRVVANHASLLNNVRPLDKYNHAMTDSKCEMLETILAKTGKEILKYDGNSLEIHTISLNLFLMIYWDIWLTYSMFETNIDTNRKEDIDEIYGQFLRNQYQPKYNLT